ADCFAFGQGFPDPDDPIRNMPICNSEIGVRALEFFCSLKDFMPPGVAAYEWAEITSDFIEGKAAIMFQWSVFVRDVEDPGKSKVAGKVGYALMPGNPDAPVNNIPGIIPGEGYASLGGWGLVMNKDSKNKEAAWEFISWASCLTMTHKEMMEYLEFGGTNTGRKSAYFIPETKGYRVGRYPIELEMYREHIRRRPAIAEEVEYEIIVGTEVQQAFIGSKTPKQALDDAAKALYELMVKGGYIPEDQPLVWPSKYVNPDGTIE
ncbi:MAG: extracellular solute-binding protein, partial [Candidatus Caldatribacteriaceae bacterium]